ncbi:hypothetical protein NUM3379_16150 [Kineococcus sp. NUM-3379]
MPSHPLRTALLRTAAALTVPGVLLATAGPAAAAPKDSTSTKRSGASAFVKWTEYDFENLLPIPDSNVHVGFLSVSKEARGTFLHGQITDWQCDPGEVPGGHAEPGTPGTCDYVRDRMLGSEAMTLIVDARAGTAVATGEVIVSNGGHGGPGTELGRVPARVELRGSGPMASYTSTETWNDGTSTYRSRIRGVASGDAVVTGALGAMGFTDDRDDVSYGSFRTYTEVSRERIG